jgi:hypothetical protein
MVFEKENPFSKFECFEHVKTFWFVSSFEHEIFVINEK